ncbi:MAG: hydrogenase maturation protease [Chloroflexota bacterium]
MQSDFFEEFRQRVEGKRVLILGVGNRMRGDDGLGSRMIARLKGKLDLPMLDAGDVPENFLGPIEDARADLVLVIDAADLRASPGDLALLELNQLGGMAVSTHTVNLGLLFKVIPASRRPQVLVLAVQPQSTEFGAGLSREIRSAMDGIESLLLGIFS